MLRDGVHDVFVVDARDDEHEATIVHLALTILQGAHKSAHKSEVIGIAARDFIATRSTCSDYPVR